MVWYGDLAVEQGVGVGWNGWVRRFDASGTSIDASPIEVSMSSRVTGLAAASDGRFIIAHTGGTAQRFNADGTAYGPWFLLQRGGVSANVQEVDVVFLTNGCYVAAFSALDSDNAGVYARLFPSFALPQ